jgi:predicted nucleotidyltransferase
MFTPEDRTRLRDELVAAARADPRVTGCALTGSAAAGAEDRWSDIDLAVAVAAGADPGAVAADWTDRMYRAGRAVHHLDMYRGDTLFRVFLLADTLQVDIAFWPAAEFGAYGPNFQLLFGAAREPPTRPPAAAAELVGLGWLYALHVRSGIERGRPWQAEYMLSAMRDQVLALACLRHGLPAVEGRGIDRLPPEVTAPVTEGLVRSLDAAELWRAFRVVTEAMIAEIERADPGLAGRLAPVLRELAGAGPPPAGGAAGPGGPPDRGGGDLLRGARPPASAPTARPSTSAAARSPSDKAPPSGGRPPGT